jgi:type I restriction enzyme R subunit
MTENINQTPEQQARDRIDKMLGQAGWAVQDKNAINFNAGPGIAVREYQTDRGPADYILFVDRKPVGVIEAKREEEGHRMTVHERQVEYYAESKLKWIVNSEPLPFLYESTGEVSRFCEQRDPKPRWRPIFSFHQPQTLRSWLKKEKSLRGRLHDIPVLNPQGLRGCQVRAVTNLEESFKKNRPRALIQMATGSGKTYTSITAVYRLLKFADAKRVLFLVDTKNLGKQAEQEFMAYTPNDDNRKFTELYNVQRLKSSYIAKDSQMCISTIQRLYSILKGVELDETAEEENPNERLMPKEPMPVVYSERIPIEFFDFIIIDECHRSIYNLWKQVLEYFDAFLMGLTATPDQRTLGFFNKNFVSEYTHEEAVADGVNVGYDVFLIETKITKNGSKIVAKEYIDKRERLTRRQWQEQLDEDVEYNARQLDKDVVNKDQIRTVIRTFRDKLPTIFKGRREVPKTLIFAKTDSHADDIIQIVREEFDEGNEFCKKVTYKSQEDPDSILSSFRNDYNPRIAVTVDMIATGTDVKPLECLLFMRDVRSKNYFEQMKGRGTRSYGYDDLKKVTPSVNSKKTHFVIVDAVGVTKSIKTDSRPLERKPTVPLKDLLYGVMMGASDEDTFTSLANRLARLEKQITIQEKETFKEKAGDKSIHQAVHELLESHHPDRIEDLAREKFDISEEHPVNDEQKKEAQQELISRAAETFTGELNEYVENVRRIHEQIIDTVNINQVTRAEWDGQAADQAKEIIEDFKSFLEEHKDEITALQIFYQQPYRRRELTFKMIKEVFEILKREKPQLAPLRIWQAYEQVEKVNGQSPKSELITLVSLIRHVTNLDAQLTGYDATVNRHFQDWVMHRHKGNAPKFNEVQMNWLRMIRDHIAASVHFEMDDLNYAPFDAKGGAGKMYELFGDGMNKLIDELNEVLVA